MAGLEAARARGRKGGGKPVMDEKKLALAKGDAQEPGDTRKGGVRGGGVVALDALPPPQTRRGQSRRPVRELQH